MVTLNDLAARRTWTLSDRENLGADLRDPFEPYAVGPLARALEVCESDLSERQDHPDTHFRIAALLVREGRLAEAEPIVDWLSSRLPLWAAVHVLSARVARLGGHLERAMLCAVIAERVARGNGDRPSLAAALAEVAEVHRARKADDRAFNTAMSALSLGSPPAALRCAATIGFARRDPAGAFSHLRLLHALHREGAGRPASPPSGTRWAPGSSDRLRSLVIVDDLRPGDLFQFIRYAPRAASVADSILLCADGSLLPAGALASLGISDVVHEVPAGEAWIFASDLPSLFATPGDPYPHADGYLPTPHAERLAWEARLAARLPRRGLRIGLAWRDVNDADECAVAPPPLAAFASLLSVPGTQIVSLQRTPPDEDLRLINSLETVHHAGTDLNVWASTAGLLSAVDLIVTADSDIAQLAGAMGHPAFFLCREPRSWRWAHGGRITPWYRSMSIFRQAAPGNWDLPIAIVSRVVKLAAQNWAGNFRPYDILHIKQTLISEGRLPH
jgi:hypothetical protein